MHTSQSIVPGFRLAELLASLSLAISTGAIAAHQCSK